MAAPRTTSIRALRQLSKATHPSLAVQQSRSLRITPHVDSSPFLTTSKPSRARVQVAIDEAKPAEEKLTPANTRQFNTSRSLKAVGDTSTIDFAYLPDFDPDAGVQVMPSVRVPLLPEALYPGSSKRGYTAEEEEIVMRPEISLASGGHVAAPSALAEVVDNNAIDFQGMADAVKAKATEVVEEGSEIKRVFDGFLDDLFGVKAKKST